MAKAFNELTANTETEQLSHAEWLALLLDREWIWRYDRKLAARLRFAKLRHQAAPEHVDYRSERGLDRALFMKLIAGDWIDAHDNPAGSGSRDHPTGMKHLLHSSPGNCIATGVAWRLILLTNRIGCCFSHSFPLRPPAHEWRFGGVCVQPVLLAL